MLHTIVYGCRLDLKCFSSFVTVFSSEVFLPYFACCTYKGPNLDDIEHNIVYRVNNKLMVHYNSTKGNWTGYTPFAMEKAKILITDPK